MNPDEDRSIQRHESLQDLSRDHHRVLVLCKEIELAVEPDDSDVEDEEDEEAFGQKSPGEMAEEVWSFWQEEGMHHFREEEEAILPVYLRSVNLDEDPVLLQVLDDHAWIRDAATRLRKALDNDQPYDDLLKTFGQRLRKHARLEEREFFEQVQEKLNKEELQEIGERSRQYRSEFNMPIGPD